MASNLLAHLIPRIVDKPEPAATKALAYILRASLDVVAREFVTIVGQTGIDPFTPGRIKAGQQHGKKFPDLTIYDTDDTVRIFVENKFWSGLTKAQPVDYLKKLPENTSSSLLFVVPHQRIHSVWSELAKECGHHGIDLGKTQRNDVTWARAGQRRRTMAITSWEYVLERLHRVAVTSGNATLAQDIAQLQGLTDQMSIAEFLPLHEEEVTGVNVARRLINYSDLIEEIVDRLVADGIASKQDRGDGKRLKPTHGWNSAGRYLCAHKRFGLWLGVDLEAWRDYEITPVWWELNPGDPFSGVQGKSLQPIRNMVDDVQETDAGQLRIPIRLTTGAERDRVIDDAVQQMRSIAGMFLKAFPDE